MWVRAILYKFSGRFILASIFRIIIIICTIRVEPFCWFRFAAKQHKSICSAPRGIYTRIYFILLYKERPKCCLPAANNIEKFYIFFQFYFDCIGWMAFTHMYTQNILRKVEKSIYTPLQYFNKRINWSNTMNNESKCYCCCTHKMTSFYAMQCYRIFSDSSGRCFPFMAIHFIPFWSSTLHIGIRWWMYIVYELKRIRKYPILLLLRIPFMFASLPSFENYIWNCVIIWRSYTSLTSIYENSCVCRKVTENWA